MFIFKLKYWDMELYIRDAEIKAESEKDAHDKLRKIVNTKFIKTESIKEEE